MQTYISILRGINVSGQKLIKMEALRKSYEKSGFLGVTSYLQSGNVIFLSNDNEVDKLERTISLIIKNDFDFDVPVIVLTIDKLKQIIDNNPFLEDPEKDPAFFHVSFLASRPRHSDHKHFEDKKQTGEDVFLSDSVIYLYCPNGYGRTKLNNNFLETRLKVIVTTRNWKTTNEIYKLAKNT